jgi:hypothetical protein
LRENVTRSGHRPLALELAGNHARHRAVRLERLHSYLLRFGRRAANNFCRLKLSLAVVINPLKSMSTKIPECWASDPNARAVKIELSAEQSLLLPFDQFAFSELKSEGKEQQLRLVFATHEVLVRGHSLRRIETAMQRMELSLLIALPSKQRSEQ